MTDVAMFHELHGPVMALRAMGAEYHPSRDRRECVDDGDRTARSRWVCEWPMDNVAISFVLRKGGSEKVTSFQGRTATYDTSPVMGENPGRRKPRSASRFWMFLSAPIQTPRFPQMEISKAHTSPKALIETSHGCFQALGVIPAYF
jgi:hypothetical protein